MLWYSQPPSKLSAYTNQAEQTDEVVHVSTVEWACQDHVLLQRHHVLDHSLHSFIVDVFASRVLSSEKHAVS